MLGVNVFGTPAEQAQRDGRLDVLAPVDRRRDRADDTPSDLDNDGDGDGGVGGGEVRSVLPVPCDRVRAKMGP